MGCSSKPTPAIIRIITAENNWIEGEAIRQLEKTAELPGMIMAVGLPELHPGKGIPVGAVFATIGIFYPYLVGNDVGCGMGLWRTDLKRRKIKLDRWTARLDLESPLHPDVAVSSLEKEGIPSGIADPGLGSIGGGNHFSELQMIEKVEDPELFQKLGLSTEELVLLVHSGSRVLGKLCLDPTLTGIRREDSRTIPRTLPNILRGTIMHWLGQGRIGDLSQTDSSML